ncbi:MAG: DUF1289 domain-containing protein [Proteobacteria bacterium]|nr:DUF1289 domain-containing protein [Pseudomonadota bacterium]
MARWRDDNPPSPCISICTLDADGVRCVGCLRTLDEIARWERMSADDKRAVIAALPARRAEAFGDAAGTAASAAGDGPRG